MRPVESTCLEVGWGALDHDVWMQTHESLLGVTEMSNADKELSVGVVLSDTSLLNDQILSI